jgi:hypothetical protein
MLVKIYDGKARWKKTTTKAKMRVDNIKMDFWDIEWGGVDWIDLVQDRDKWRDLVNAVMNLWFLQNARSLSSGYITDGTPE